MRQKIGEYIGFIGTGTIIGYGANDQLNKHRNHVQDQALKNLAIEQSKNDLYNKKVLFQFEQQKKMMDIQFEQQKFQRENMTLLEEKFDFVKKHSKNEIETSDFIKNEMKNFTHLINNPINVIDDTSHKIELSGDNNNEESSDII